MPGRHVEQRPERARRGERLASAEPECGVAAVAGGEAFEQRCLADTGFAGDRRDLAVCARRRQRPGEGIERLVTFEEGHGIRSAARACTCPVYVLPALETTTRGTPERLSISTPRRTPQLDHCGRGLFIFRVHLRDAWGVRSDPWGTSLTNWVTRPDALTADLFPTLHQSRRHPAAATSPRSRGERGGNHMRHVTHLRYGSARRSTLLSCWRTTPPHRARATIAAAVTAWRHGSPAPPALVQAVRDATRQFQDVSWPSARIYGPFLGCVSGTQEGAMGVHYVNGELRRRRRDRGRTIRKR